MKNYDDNELLEALANRGVDARPIEKFSMTEINNDITRRRMEAERAEMAQAEADADLAQAESDAMAQSEAEAEAEDNTRADQERIARLSDMAEADEYHEDYEGR